MIRVIGLGSEMARDDGAALEAARRLSSDVDVEVLLAGRPGAGLLDLFDARRPTVLLDVVRTGAPPGSCPTSVYRPGMPPRQWLN